MGAYDDYLSAVVDRFWDYADREFGDRLELFKRSERSPSRSPEFAVGAAEHNLLYPPSAEPRVRQTIVTSLPPSERHRHFASMRSSQALAQSVFGSLAVLGKAGVLAGLSTDDGLPTVRGGATVQMEYLVEHLGEPRSTSVDVWLDDGEQRVAVECKFTERRFSQCTRPTLRPDKNANYERDHCDGTYTRPQSSPHFPHRHSWAAVAFQPADPHPRGPAVASSCPGFMTTGSGAAGWKTHMNQ